RRRLERDRQVGRRAVRHLPQARRRRSECEIRWLQVRGRLLHQHRHGDRAASADADDADLRRSDPAGAVRLSDEAADADQARLQESQAYPGNFRHQCLSGRLLGRPGIQLVRRQLSHKHDCSQIEQHRITAFYFLLIYRRGNIMKKFATAILSATLLISTAAFAQDAMKKDEMSHDGMAKDNMSKDGMKKDGMKKDHMSKDGMKKDAMKKDHMSKDGMKKDEMSHDGMSKDGMSK